MSIKRINAAFLGTCPLCCTLSPPQMARAACTHQVSQGRGVLGSAGLRKLLPLRGADPLG